MKVPENLNYSKDHEWARLDDGKVVVGITDFAQQQLGDVVYIELPSLGTRVKAGGAFGVIESVKAVSDLLSPVSGEVVDVNRELPDHPEWVNQDPYGKAWMIVVAPEDPSEMSFLMDAQGYAGFLAEEAG